jgi:hypothetical protein
MTCSLCGRPIEDTSKHLVAKQVVGWEMPRGPRAKGGLHALALPRDTGAYAHVNCVNQAKRGVLAQESLLDQTPPLWS